MNATHRTATDTPEELFAVVPRTELTVRGTALRVKWFTSRGPKIARFRIATDDNVVTLDDVTVERDGQRVHVRDAGLDAVDGQVLDLIRSKGYEPAEEGDR